MKKLTALIITLLFVEQTLAAPSSETNIHARKYSKFKTKEEKIVLDYSCDKKLIYEHGLKQACVMNADPKSCLNLNMNTIVSAYLVSGNLDKESLRELTGPRYLEKTIKMIETYKVEQLKAIKAANHQFEVGRRLWTRTAATYMMEIGKENITQLTPREGEILKGRFSSKLSLSESDHSGLSQNGKLLFMDTTGKPENLIAKWRSELPLLQSFHFNPFSYTSETPEVSGLHQKKIEIEQDIRRQRATVQGAVEVKNRTLTESAQLALAQLETRLSLINFDIERALRTLTPEKRLLYDISESIHVTYNNEYQLLNETKKAVATNQKDMDSVEEKAEALSEEARKAKIEKINKRLAARNSRVAVRGGAMDVAVALAHYTDNISLSSCAKEAGLTSKEVDVLKAGVLRFAKAGKINGLFDKCSNLVITDPQNTYKEMSEIFGGIPTGTCSLLKKSKARLTDIETSLKDKAKPICNSKPPTAVSKNYKIIQNDKGYELIYSDGPSEIRIPSKSLRALPLSEIDQMRIEGLDQNLKEQRKRKQEYINTHFPVDEVGNDTLLPDEKRSAVAEFKKYQVSLDKIRQQKDTELEADLKDLSGAQIPYFNFSTIKVINSKSKKEDKNKTLALQQFYKRIHPPDEVNTRPDLTDLSFDCTSASKADSKLSAEASQFCALRKIMLQARQAVSEGVFSSDSICVKEGAIIPTTDNLKPGETLVR